MTLRILVFGVLSLVTMIPLFLFWAWPHSKALQNEIDAVSDRNLQIAQSVAQALGRYERDVRSLFGLLAINLTEGKALPKPKELSRVDLTVSMKSASERRPTMASPPGRSARASPAIRRRRSSTRAPASPWRRTMRGGRPASSG